MITLDTDLSLIYRLFDIAPKKVTSKYAGMPIDDIMKAEAAQGNTKAANFDKEILSNPAKLIEFFKLNDAGNKYAILSNMSDKDLEDLLPLLKPEDMQMGLKFFDKNKLLELVEKLPKKQLLKMMFDMFSPEQIMQLMPENQIDKVLLSPKMDKNLEMKCLKTLKPEILAQMIESVTGKPIQSLGTDGSGLNVNELLKQMQELPDNKFKEAMINIPRANKRAFMLQLTKQEPKIFLLFDSKAYTGIIERKKKKQEIIKSTEVLKPENIVKMLKALPQKLTAIVMTQIDPKMFADVLIANFKDILSQIIAT